MEEELGPDEGSVIAEYKRALTAVGEQLKMVQEEKESVQEMHEEFKQHYEKLKKENGELRVRMMEALSEKKQAEAEAESQMKHLKNLLDQRQQALENQRARYSPLQDADLLKASLTRSIEAPYKHKLEALEQEIERLELEVMELNRINTYMKAELEETKKECDRGVMSVKQKSQEQIHDLMMEIQELQGKADDHRDRELARNYKRDAEEFKRKHLDAQKELMELRRERDALNNDKRGLLQERENLVEHEQLQDEEHRGEIDKIAGLLKASEEECAREMHKVVEREETIRELSGNNDDLGSQLHQTEMELAAANQRAAELEQEVNARELAIEQYLMEVQEEDKERVITEREEKSVLQVDIERLEEELRRVQELRQEEVAGLSERVEHLENDRRVFNEEHQMLKARFVELQSSYDRLKAGHMRVLDHRDKLEEEVQMVQSRYRALLASNQQTVVEREHLEVSVQTIEEEYQKVVGERQMWQSERLDLHAQFAQLTGKLEQTIKESAEQVRHYKSKASEYRSRLTQAELRAQQISTRAAKVQSEFGRYDEEPAHSFHGVSPHPLHGDYSINRELYNTTPDANLLEIEIARTLDAHKQ